MSLLFKCPDEFRHFFQVCFIILCSQLDFWSISVLYQILVIVNCFIGKLYRGFCKFAMFDGQIFF